jgi:hypothetical protein
MALNLQLQFRMLSIRPIRLEFGVKHVACPFRDRELHQ